MSAAGDYLVNAALEVKSLKDLGLESYVIETVHRSQLKNAPYNPRRISDHEKAKLKAVLKRHGHVAPITWNRATGHIVGGHQRISLTDSLAGTADYTMQVAVIEVSEPREKELNIALNNAHAMGEFDMERLKDLFKDENVTVAVRSEAIAYRGLRPDEIDVFDIVYAVIDSASKTGSTHDGIGVVYWGLRPGGRLVILDWDITQVDAAFLDDWIPNVFTRLEQLTHEHLVTQGSGGAFIEDKDSGIYLNQQAKNKGWPVTPIESKMTSLGKVGRCLNVATYVHQGYVKFLDAAYRKVVEYKGFVQNHLLTQVLTFSPSTGDQGADDLLDGFSYGIPIGLGNPEGF